MRTRCSMKIAARTSKEKHSSFANHRELGTYKQTSIFGQLKEHSWSDALSRLLPPVVSIKNSFEGNRVFCIAVKLSVGEALALVQWNRKYKFELLEWKFLLRSASSPQCILQKRKTLVTGRCLQLWTFLCLADTYHIEVRLVQTNQWRVLQSQGDFSCRANRHAIVATELKLNVLEILFKSVKYTFVPKIHFSIAQSKSYC